jgi:thiol-disulfide isomerase/thioredoxin
MRILSAGTREKPSAIFFLAAGLSLALGCVAGPVRSNLAATGGTNLSNAGVVGPASLSLVAPAARSQQVAPGIGAETEDPRKVLRDADRALSVVRSVSYDAEYQGIGAFGTRSATVTGKVRLAKLPAGDPLVARMAAEGVFYQTGSAEGVPFHTAFDGRTVRKLRTQTKTMIVKDVETDPKGRNLGGVTMLFGGGAYQLIMFEYVEESPLAKRIEAQLADYEGRTVVSGVLCHVVYVENGQRADGRIIRERWFIGMDDNLPRKFESVAVDDKGRFGAHVLTLSDVRVNPALDARDFGIEPPECYTVTPYAPPSHPVLLAPGQAAPAWKLTDAEGRMHALEEFRGKLVVLDFWATWCGPCVRGMPEMQKLYEAYHGRGIEVVGVNAWEESNAAAYMKEKGYTYTLLLKGETIADAYHVSTLPTIYVIGRDGIIVYSGGATDAGTLAALLEEELKEAGAQPQEFLFNR